MRLSLISLLLLAAPALAQDTSCTLEGTVALTRAGKPLSPERAVVYVKRASWKNAEPSEHVIVQKNKAFVPEVLIALKGDRVKFVNQDEFEHSVFSRSIPNSFEAVSTRKETTHIQKFEWPGTVRIQCDIHARMRADVLVLQNGFFARPGADGKWRISGLGKQKYTLVFWEPNGGTVEREVTGCVSGPMSVSLAEKAPEQTRRKDGSAYREYEE